MILKSIKLKTFKCFENYEVHFEKINLIEGAIGIGKSTILEALIFALYGYSGASLLSDIPTRNKATSCKVEAVIEDLGHIIEVIREFPLKLTIKEDGKTLKLSTAEGNRYLEDRFGTRVNFSIFRILDAYSKEANFLEEGTTTLKKILFANTDTLFNEVRNNLNAIKLEREKYNKDTAVVYKHYPSEKRLKLLVTKFDEISIQYIETENEVGSSEQELNRKNLEMSRNDSRMKEIKRKLDDLEKQFKEIEVNAKTTINQKICYVCKKPLEEKSYEEIRQEQDRKMGKLQLEKIDLQKEYENLSCTYPDLLDQIKILTEIKTQYLETRNSIRPHREKLQALIIKLQGRLKQKEYIYTERDVIIVKKAITELDNLSSIYLVETVRALEPIINSVLEKIGFSVTFDCDVKGKFNILLERDGIKYKYHDLSCGQRLILQIALKIALLLQQGSSGLMLSDEGLSALENDNLEDIINLFKDLNFQLIFVLHRASIEDPEINIIKLGV